MTQYQFKLSGPSVVTLFDRDERVFMYTEAQSIRFVDSDSEFGNMTTFEPTIDFWKVLVQVNEYTSKLTETVRHCNIADEAVPDIDQWGVLTFPHLPKYAERIATEIQSHLVDLRMETRTVFEEYPILRRLFRHAYVECRNDVPEYLTESYQQYISERQQ